MQEQVYTANKHNLQPESLIILPIHGMAILGQYCVHGIGILDLP